MPTVKSWHCGICGESNVHEVCRYCGATDGMDRFQSWIIYLRELSETGEYALVACRNDRSRKNDVSLPFERRLLGNWRVMFMLHDQLTWMLSKYAVNVPKEVG